MNPRGEGATIMARSATDNGPHIVDRHVGRRVSEKRLAMGYSQSDLGRALGLTFQQVQKYEKGTNRISSSKLWEIAKFLNVDIEHFFEGLATDTPPENRSLSTNEETMTRLSMQIVRLAPQLSSRQQKLALELIRSMKSRQNADPQ